MTADILAKPPEATAGMGVRRVAAVAGVAAIGMAVYQVSTSGAPAGATYDTAGDYLREILFLIYLSATIATVASAHRLGWAPNRPALLIGVGYSLITVGVTIGLAVRDELSWFFALAGPGLVASTVGFVWWALWARRHAVLSTWAATLMGVGGVTAVVLSEVGTSVLIGAFWCYVAATGVRAPIAMSTAPHR